MEFEPDVLNTLRATRVKNSVLSVIVQRMHELISASRESASERLELPAWQAVEREESQNERSYRVRSSRASRARLSPFPCFPLLRTPATQHFTINFVVTDLGLVLRYFWRMF